MASSSSSHSIVDATLGLASLIFLYVSLSDFIPSSLRAQLAYRQLSAWRGSAQAHLACLVKKWLEQLVFVPHLGAFRAELQV